MLLGTERMVESEIRQDDKSIKLEYDDSVAHNMKDR